MEIAREERQMELSSLRISAQRREPSPDSWKMSAFSRRSPSFSKLTASGRDVAGFERFQFAKEATSDISVTSPQQRCRDEVPQRNRDVLPLRYRSSTDLRQQNSVDQSDKRKQDMMRTPSTPVLRARSPLRCRKVQQKPMLQKTPETAASWLQQIPRLLRYVSPSRQGHP